MTVYGDKTRSVEMIGVVGYPSVVGDPDLTVSGNVILRVGRKHADGWTQTEHVTLTPDEWKALKAEVDEQLFVKAIKEG